MPVLPILRSDDGRSLPQTFRGGQVTSTELSGLTLYGGQFRGNSPRNDASMEDMSMNGRGAFTSDRFNFGGGEYAFNEKAHAGRRLVRGTQRHLSAAVFQPEPQPAHG